jgi:hypothetical protein
VSNPEEIVQQESSPHGSTTAAKIVEIESGGADAFDQIEEVLGHPPTMWTPKGVPEGAEADKCLVTNQVSGQVETVEDRSGDYGPYKVLVVVRKDRSRVQVAGFGTVLAGWFNVIRPGDMVGIKFEGSVPSPTPGYKPYDSYTVAVRRDGRPVSQSRVLGEYDEPVDEAEALEMLSAEIERARLAKAGEPE